MSELMLFPGAHLNFEATAIMPNNKRQTFDNTERFLERVADQYDPITVEMVWEQKLSIPFSATAKIKIVADTGRKIQGPRQKSEKSNLPCISLSVSGASEDWVERSYEKIEPVLKNSILHGIYSPFYLLNSQATNFFVLSGLMISAWIVASHRFNLKLIDNSAREAIYNEIISATDISLKIDKLAYFIMFPSGSGPFGLISIFGGITIIFILISTLNPGPLKFLVPRSYIAIGLAKHRYEQYENSFKFIVFTIICGSIVSGIMMPILRSLLS